MIARSQPSVAVIGAGPGGLASAMLLAASGLPVTVYEAQDEIGGRTGRVHQDGYSFDRGPTFFLMPYVLDEIFAAAGQRLSDRVELERLDPMYRLIVGQRDGSSPITLDATQDVQEMARRIAAIDAADGAAFPRFIADNRVKLKALEPVLRRPFKSPMDLVSPEVIRAAPHVRPHMTVDGLLGRYFKHPAVRLATGFQSKYLGMSPLECPSLFTILPFIEYEYGVWHPRGGCHALMLAMAEVAESLGVRIETGAPVDAIDFEGRRATGVIVNGERHPHDHVVVNADATWAMKKLIPERLRGRETDARIDARRYSCSTFMMYLGVRGDVDLPHHSIYISSKYRENLDDISNRGRLSEDPSFYVCNPSPRDPSLAPDGCSSLYVLVPTPNCTSEIDWAGQTPHLREEAFKQIERRLGISDLRDRTEVEILCTPSDWRGMNINHGATFNLAHTLGQMLHKRPKHRLPQTDGVWLVGGGTHPGSGLPVIFLSSQITSRLLCEEVGASYAGTDVPLHRIGEHASDAQPALV
ncbi:MAG: phytoene desaturase family protein [Planctomycetota bacterium]